VTERNAAGLRSLGHKGPLPGVAGPSSSRTLAARRARCPHNRSPAVLNEGSRTVRTADTPWSTQGFIFGFAPSVQDSKRPPKPLPPRLTRPIGSERINRPSSHFSVSGGAWPLASRLSALRGAHTAIRHRRSRALLLLRVRVAANRLYGASDPWSDCASPGVHRITRGVGDANATVQTSTTGDYVTAAQGWAIREVAR